MSDISAGIFGCSGLVLTDEERAFFERVQPLGFIVFARNIESPAQLKSLTEQLRVCVSHDAPILVDQEGGRVQRLRSPHWREAPPARVFGDLAARDQAAGLEAIRLNYRLIAAELRAVGLDTDCVPCLDVPVEGAHDIIGNRAFSLDPAMVGLCGKAAWQGLSEGGVLPIGKHIPGHGRALADSHLDLPRVSTDLKTLEETDFVPFRALADIPLGMTAHIIFDAIDAERTITQSAAGIAYLREQIGFDGLLMTDDLSMKALGGDFTSRTEKCFEAGCDVVLHCNGDMDEMQAIEQALPKMSSEASRRWAAAEGIRSSIDDFDPNSAQSELDRLLS